MKKGVEIIKLSKTVECLLADEELTGKREKREEEEKSLKEDLQIIQVILTGVSSYAGAEMPSTAENGII